MAPRRYAPTAILVRNGVAESIGMTCRLRSEQTGGIAGIGSYRYFSMLRSRELLSEIANCRVSELRSGRSLEAIPKIDRISAGGASDLLTEITKALGLKRGFTHVLPYSLKVPLIQRSFGIVDEDSIRIKQTERITALLENLSPLYKGIVDDAECHFIRVIGLTEKSVKKSDDRVERVKSILTTYFEGNSK